MVVVVVVYCNNGTMSALCVRACVCVCGMVGGRHPLIGHALWSTTLQCTLDGPGEWWMLWCSDGQVLLRLVS